MNAKMLMMTKVQYGDRQWPLRNSLETQACGQSKAGARTYKHPGNGTMSTPVGRGFLFVPAKNRGQERHKVICISICHAHAPRVVRHIQTQGFKHVHVDLMSKCEGGDVNLT